MANWLLLPTHLAAVCSPHRPMSFVSSRINCLCLIASFLRKLREGTRRHGIQETGIQYNSQGDSGELPGSKGAERITSPRKRGVEGVSRDVSKTEKIKVAFYLMFNSIERNFTILSKFEQEWIMSTQTTKQLKKMKQLLTPGDRKRYKKGSIQMMVYYKAQLWITLV